MGQRCGGAAGCSSFNTRRMRIEKRPPTAEQSRLAVDRLAALVVYFCRLRIQGSKHSFSSAVVLLSEFASILSNSCFRNLMCVH